MKQLDPKSEWIFFFQYLIISFAFTSGIAYPIFLLLESSDGQIYNLLQSVIVIETIALLISIFFALIMAHYAYKFYKYELREDGFRKEHGVIWKKYTTIPYERIQNVDIYRGILARILGLSDLQIQTAGMSTIRGSYGAGSEGRLPGVTQEEAEKLRNELVRRARGVKNQGI